MTTSATPVRRLVNRFLCQGTVEAVDDLTPRMRRIRITGEAVRGLDWRPGQHVKLQVGSLLRDFRDALRTYSIWDHDGDSMQLCVLDHSEGGPGARWSREVEVGQQVSFTRPEGRLVIQDDAPYHLFVGDETAAVAFGAMLRSLPFPARVHAVLQADTPADRLPLPHPNEITWVHGSDPLIDTLRAMDLPAEPGIAYIAGETRTCQDVRRHLVRDRDWPRRSTIVKPFWAPGKRGMD